jgi:tetratricopeptide (TPR) repeat protein
MDRGATGASPTDVDRMLRDGIAAAKAGECERARDLLVRVVELDEGRLSAWLWLSGVVDSVEDKEVCLENVLTLDPNHSAAQRGLEWIRAQERAGQAAVEAEPAAEMAQQVTDSETPLHVAQDEAPQAPSPLWAEPPSELLCPYCAAPTKEGDRRCAACDGSLWVRIRRRETHSLWLWNLMIVRFSMAIFYAMMPVIALSVVSYLLVNEFNPLLLVPEYLGRQGELSPELVNRALTMLPRAYILPFVALSLYSFLLLVAMYLRWRPALYFILGGIAIRFALSVTAAAFGQYYGLLCGGIGVVVALLSFLIVMRVVDDFAWDDKRVYFGLDRQSQGGTARLQRAHSFSQRGMWALAVLYLRAAVAKLPGRVVGHIRLAHAYTHLGRTDLARQALQAAQEVAPDDPQVEELAHLLGA